MSDMVPSNELLTHESFVDWDELSGLDKVVTIYQVGTNTVVVDTCDGREVKITAWFDRRKGRVRRRLRAPLHRDERRKDSCRSGRRRTPTRAPRPTISIGCLEAAILAVDRLHVY